MSLYGLIGHPVSHSFSARYFTELFRKEKLDHSYELFDLRDIRLLPQLIELRSPFGLNVTLPHKASVLAYMDQVDPQAAEAGAVNCIHIQGSKLLGYNTDIPAFKEWVESLSLPGNREALVFGSGGSSKAVSLALKQLNIPFRIVSRTPLPDQLHYSQLNQKILAAHTLLINCTPCGMWPDVNERLALPYEFITPVHTVLDLIYNPAETLFMRECRLRGASVFNGSSMLYRQAELSWKIWQGSATEISG